MSDGGHPGHTDAHPANLLAGQHRAPVYRDDRRTLVLPAGHRNLVHPQAREHQGLGSAGSHSLAGRPSDRQSRQALAAVHTPGLRESRASPVVSRRVLLPVQPPQCSSAGMLFYRLLEQAIQASPVRGEDLLVRTIPRRTSPPRPASTRAIRTPSSGTSSPCRGGGRHRSDRRWVVAHQTRAADIQWCETWTRPDRGAR